jgi:hypothetical protein
MGRMDRQSAYEVLRYSSWPLICVVSRLCHSSPTIPSSWGAPCVDYAQSALVQNPFLTPSIFPKMTLRLSLSRSFLVLSAPFIEGDAEPN